MAIKYSEQQKNDLLANVRKHLEAAGIDVAAIERRVEETRKYRRQFETPLAPGVVSSITHLREGWEEFRKVGRYGGGRAFRCQAQRKRKPGVQCGRCAVKGKRVCRAHGGGSTGSRTAEGRAKQGQHFVTHGNETIAARKRRRKAAKELREMELHMLAAGQMEAGVLGPQIGRTSGRIDIKAYIAKRPDTVRRAQQRARDELARREAEANPPPKKRRRGPLSENCPTRINMRMRAQQVIALMAKGLTKHEVAAILGVCERVIRRDLHRLRVCLSD